MRFKQLTKRLILATVCITYAAAGCDTIVRDSVLQGALTGALAATEGFITGFFEAQFGVSAEEHAEEAAEGDAHEEGGNALFIHQ
ncbi:MAG: hypothetical protein C4547_02270 [Phycisphaerales bacterium]|nr:MAG: hypothetical protein C4547_02270 [Phycisphaerales bacterium]